MTLRFKNENQKIKLFYQAMLEGCNTNEKIANRLVEWGYKRLTNHQVAMFTHHSLKGKVRTVRFLPQTKKRNEYYPQ